MVKLNLMTIKHLIIDMDGVLWRGAQVIPGAPEFIRFLRERGIAFVLATNNSTRTVEEYVAKLAGFGMEVAPHEIVTSAVATADYLATLAAPSTPVYVVGGKGLSETLAQKGFVLDGNRAQYVVAGQDLDLTFDKLRRATLLIRAGARLIGSNPDKTFPSEEGIIPGAGAILAALEAATETVPVIVGKPEPIMFEQAMKRIGGTRADTAMLGDRLETDIWGGQRAGLKTILVLSGVTTPEDLADSEYQPTWVFRDVDELRRRWDEM
jgi:4-nitrophenyl phosphatase